MRKRIITLALAAAMSLSLAACGDKKEENDTKATTQAATQAASESTTEAATEATTEAPAAVEAKTVGEWSVEVPGGWELKIGDFLDENDTRYFAVKKSDFYYFDFKSDGEDSIKKNYDHNKKTYTNEQQDVQATIGSGEWTGFQYSDGFGGYGFEAYTTIDNTMIRVSSAGFAFDSEETKAVLGSLKHIAASENGVETTEAKNDSETTSEETTTEATTEAAPVYAKTIEMKVGTVGIPEGYTEKKDAAPSQYVMENDTTGGKVSYFCSGGTADEQIDKIMSGLTYEKQDYDFDGVTWTGGIADGFYCFATNVGDKYLSISIDFGGTMEEMEALIKGVEIKAE